MAKQLELTHEDNINFLKQEDNTWDLEESDLIIISNNKSNNSQHEIIYENKESVSENSNTKIKTETFYIEDIIELQLDKLSSNIIIQYQCFVAYFIQLLLEDNVSYDTSSQTDLTRNDNYIENEKIPKLLTNKKYESTINLEESIDKLKDISNYLTWLYNTSNLLADKINQTKIINNHNHNYISRSSYTFCNKYTQCKNFYNLRELPTCKEHHYVHNLLSNDINSLIVFINNLIETKTLITKEIYNNIFSSVKTICYVTRHMSKEINYIHYITKNNSEIYHRNNPFDIIKINNFNISKNNNVTQDITVPKSYDRHNRDTYPVKRVNGQVKLEKTSIHSNKNITKGFSNNNINEIKTLIGNNKFNILKDE